MMILWAYSADFNPQKHSLPFRALKKSTAGF